MGKDKIQAFINSRDKVNAITSIYITKLGFIIQKIDIGTQKINYSPLVLYWIV